MLAAERSGTALAEDTSYFIMISFSKTLVMFSVLHENELRFGK